MTKTRPLIEKVTIPDLFPSMAAKDFAHITGEDPGFRARSFYYRSKLKAESSKGKEEEEFQEIVGGFVPPAKLPGFCVVVGLGRNDDPAIKPEWNLGSKRISCLAEFEAQDMGELVTGLLDLRDKFSPALDKGFYCDGDEALAFRISQLLEGRSKLKAQSSKEKQNQTEQPLVMIPGLYFDQATGFRDYVAALFMYQKILARGKCAKVRTAMNVFPREAMTARGETAWEDFPAITALAYAVHGLMVNPMLDADEGAIEDEEG